ncbi:hypothetical protein [Geitlerinema sp. PCC 7407]|uniref:hypothetical protein n=1 Tax=Geitlerinema sp. PCC 7407 TaxID=1173025 RepID=UPI0012371B7B|nr:hypothetical protein [Geitlerinema sp. PCC 7407]
MIVFILRPLISTLLGWIWGAISFWIIPTNFFNVFQFTGLDWIDFLIGCFIYIFIIFSCICGILIAAGIEDEFRRDSDIQQFVLSILLLPFVLIGIGFSNLYILSNKAIFLILVLGSTIIFCFLTTVLDFVQVATLGSESLYTINIFTDHASYTLGHLTGNVIYTKSFLSWIKEDQIYISSFFDYWLYSLNASIGGYRVSGFGHFVARVFNLICSILYFILGYFTIISTLNNSLDNLGGIKSIQEAIEINKSILRLERFLSNVISSLVIFVLFRLIFWWVSQGSLVNISVTQIILLG